MAKAIGRIAAVGIAKESVRGTPEAAATYWIPFEEASVDERYENVVDEASRGIREGSVGESRVRDWAEVNIKAPVDDTHFPLILLGLFGTLVTSDNADSNPAVKDHTIDVAQSAQTQALSVFVDDPAGGQDYKHGLGMIESLEIAYEQQKFLSYTLTMKAKKGATASLTPSYASYNRFLPQHVVFKLASAQSGLTGASATVIKSFNLKFTPNLEEDWSLGSTTPTDFLHKGFAVEGTLEALWANETDFKQAALAGTQKALRIDLKNTDVTIGTAANPQIQIDLYKVLFTEITRPFAINDLIKQTLSFRGHYSTTDSKMIRAVCTNIVASY